MRHGRRLTPLGKQLRTVLNGLSAAAAKPEPSLRSTETTSNSAGTTQVTFFDARYDGARFVPPERTKPAPVAPSSASGNAIANNSQSIQPPLNDKIRSPSEQEINACGKGKSTAGLQSVSDDTLQEHISARTKQATRDYDCDKVVERVGSLLKASRKALKESDGLLNHRRIASRDINAALLSLGLKQCLPHTLRSQRRNTRYGYESMQDRITRWKIQQEVTSASIKQVKNAPVARKVAPGRKISPLYNVIATAIRRDATAETTNDFNLTQWDQKNLLSRGYCADDLLVWSQALKEPDAATALRALIRSDKKRDMRTGPLFVFLHILRRPLLNESAIREALSYMRILIDRMAPSDDVVDVTQFTRPLQPISSRLVAHALKVWPQALSPIVDTVLECTSIIERQRPSMEGDHLSSATHFLNSLMDQISLSNEQLPMKAIDYQVEAIVRILRHFSEHQPVMHVNREGYRAVIRVQLAQRKTSQEQQWAELKALSWPPWKHDRTGMDADIGPEHGISRAGATLRQMRDAGYPWKKWEKIASIYSGWDIDNTPTIQTRSLLGRDRPQLSEDQGIWAARITATRTMQEAWACYLSWEDAKLEPSQDVYLAIFKKMLAEKERQLKLENDLEQNEDGDIESPAWPLYPGDTPTVEPLPPSTHLYTYTRTSPPTIHQLYEQLHAKGIMFFGETLAFLVANADNVSLGLKYLIHAVRHSPDLKALLFKSFSAAALGKTREIVLIATIDLLTRVPHRPVPKSLARESPLAEPIHLFHDWQLSHNSCLARAIELLRARPLTNRRAWHTLLKTLTKPQFFKPLSHTIIHPTGTTLFDFNSISRDAFWAEDNNRHDAGAMVAYHLTRETLALAEKNQIRPDTLMFTNLCRATEKMTLATWSLLRRLGEQHSLIHGPHWPHIQAECVSFLSSPTAIASHLQSAFHTLTSPASDSDATDSSSGSSLLPRLACPPNPATLHAYIRALGYIGAHEALLELVEWMRTHREELLERQNLDRAGRRMMHRALVAVRVFLERNHLPSSISSAGAASPGEKGFANRIWKRENGAAGPLVRRLQAPADRRIVRKVEEIMISKRMRRIWGGWPPEEECWAYCEKMHEAGN
jgi:hypothetical protein